MKLLSITLASAVLALSLSAVPSFADNDDCNSCATGDGWAVEGGPAPLAAAPQEWNQPAASPSRDASPIQHLRAAGKHASKVLGEVTKH